LTDVCEKLCICRVTVSGPKTQAVTTTLHCAMWMFFSTCVDCQLSMPASGFLG